MPILSNFRNSITTVEVANSPGVGWATREDASVFWHIPSPNTSQGMFSIWYWWENVTSTGNCMISSWRIVATLHQTYKVIRLLLHIQAQSNMRTFGHSERRSTAAIEFQPTIPRSPCHAFSDRGWMSLTISEIWPSLLLPVRARDKGQCCPQQYIGTWYVLFWGKTAEPVRRKPYTMEIVFWSTSGRLFRIWGSPGPWKGHCHGGNVWLYSKRSAAFVIGLRRLRHEDPVCGRRCHLTL